MHVEFYDCGMTDSNLNNLYLFFFFFLAKDNLTIVQTGIFWYFKIKKKQANNM